MATLGQLAGAGSQGASPLAGFLRLLDSGVITDPNAPDVQAALAAVHQYDPNAAVVGGLNDNGEGSYMLHFDASKLPGETGGTLADPSKLIAGRDPEGGWFSPTFVPMPNDTSGLFNPNAYVDSPAYGRVTESSNVKNSSTWIDTFGPALVTLATLGAGAPMSAIGMANSVIGAGSSLASGRFNPGALASVAASAFGLPSWVGPAVGAASSLAQGNFNPMSLVPYALNAAGAPGWVAPAIQLGSGLAQGRQINPVSTGMTLAELAMQHGFGGGGWQ